MKSLVEAKLKQKTMFYEEFPKICILVFTSEILPRFFPPEVCLGYWRIGSLSEVAVVIGHGKLPETAKSKDLADRSCEIHSKASVDATCSFAIPSTSAAKRSSQAI